MFLHYLACLRPYHVQTECMPV